MTSSRPYLVRAMHQWLMDNGVTPYMLVDATAPGVDVPQQYVENGQIVLNISSQAVHALNISNKAVEFKARFDHNMTRYVRVDMPAILAIYAKENGEGMVFEPESAEESDPGTGTTETELKPDTQPQSAQKTQPKTPPKGRPHLRVIK